MCVSLMSYSSDVKYFIEFKLTEMPCQNEFTRLKALRCSFVEINFFFNVNAKR